MIPANGGQLVNLIINSSPDDHLPTVEITKDILVEMEHLAHGSYSPLTGFPSEREIESIYNTWRLNQGVIFPIPPVFPVPKETSQRLSIGKKITLAYNHLPVGTINIKEIIPFEKEKYLDYIFKTRDPTHPGVRHILSIGEFLIAGDINLFQNHSCLFDKSVTPIEMRKIILELGWKSVVVFSTSNAPHRAHEYLHRCALEMADGLLIQVIDVVGIPGKHPLEIIDRSYKKLIEGYYPQQKVLFSTLPYLVRNAGPRSSVLQAIMRQNFGCTHQIFGRDHEGYGQFYEAYESAQIFQRFPDLKIMPLLFKGPFYCQICRQIATDNSCKHEEGRIPVSGTEIRRMIKQDQDVPEWLMRKEVYNIIKDTPST